MAILNMWPFSKLINRERVQLQIAVLSISEPFDKGSKREVRLAGSMTLDSSEVSDEMIGQMYTVTISKENRRGS